MSIFSGLNKKIDKSRPLLKTERPIGNSSIPWLRPTEWKFPIPDTVRKTLQSKPSFQGMKYEAHYNSNLRILESYIAYKKMTNILDGYEFDSYLISRSRFHISFVKTDNKEHEITVACTFSRDWERKFLIILEKPEEEGVIVNIHNKDHILLEYITSRTV